MKTIFMMPFNFVFKKTTWILNSFSIKDNGASRRALSAFFAIVIMSGWVTYKNANTSNAATLVMIWLAFGALCLGMITVEQIIKLKNGDDNPNEVK